MTSDFKITRDRNIDADVRSVYGQARELFIAQEENRAAKVFSSLDEGKPSAFDMVVQRQNIKTNIDIKALPYGFNDTKPQSRPISEQLEAVKQARVGLEKSSFGDYLGGLLKGRGKENTGPSLG